MFQHLGISAVLSFIPCDYLSIAEENTELRRQLKEVNSELAAKKRELAASSTLATWESRLLFAKEEENLKDRLIKGLREQVRDLQLQVGDSEFTEPEIPPPEKRRRFSGGRGRISNSPGSKAIRTILSG